MPQSEDKQQLEELEREIRDTQNYIQSLETQLLVQEAKLIRLEGRKKSMENYLNSDND